MLPYDVTYEAVPDARLSELLATTNAAGFDAPTLQPVRRTAPPVASTARTSAPRSLLPDPLDAQADLPPSWRQVREIEDQVYAWPTYDEAYDPYRVYTGETVRNGTVHIALGMATRENKWGRDRLYIVAFLTSGVPQTALVEFLETDDYESTREFIAVIRGRDGAQSKKMFGPTDSLPQVYVERFKTVLYSDHIRVPGAWNKIGVLARDDDPETMLNHALLQARRRGDL